MSHISKAVYSTVPLEDKSDIRLLVVHPGSGDEPICCSLKTVPLSDHPRYDALSYAWGPPEQVKVLQLLDAPIEVRVNLWWALVHLRLPTQDWVVWVDALCIDQSNFGERNHQVRLMSQIFTNAEIVVAWLGCEADDSDLIMDYLAGAPIETHLIPNNDILRNSLQKIYGRSYWQRIWVLQEFGLANDVVVCCGKKMVPWNAFLLLQNDFAITEDGRPYGPHSPAITLLQYRKDRVGMPQRQFTEIYNLISLVLLFGDRLCSDPKDKIYALLSMAVD
ncbi:heterokaryon incompatibility protein-domain-containing protein, partial [Hyaloscypha finlandica]